MSRSNLDNPFYVDVGTSIVAGTAQAAFEHWLDTGMTINSERKPDEPCLFAGTGFSESDGAEGVEDEVSAK